MQRRRNKRPELMYLIILTLVVGLPAMGQTVQVGQLAHIVDQTAVELAGLGWDEWSTAAEQLGEQQQLHDQLARLINTALVTVDLDQLIGDIEQLAEELGEISACVTKGQPLSALSEECADLLILLIGTAISAEFDLNQAFGDKMKELDQRQRRTIHGRRRVSRFEEGESA